ncbi:MAG: DUF4259 domain-containing protein [Pseudomonadota bacterium]
MGAWGLGTFENDDALDWVYELEASTGSGVLNASLAAVDGADYLEAPEACAALAAAEVVAALIGTPSQDLPEEVTGWLAANQQQPDAELITMAHRAVSRIKSSSELQELWEETDEYAAWQHAMDELSLRLTASR